jgi:myo-inositol-1(or 4)-monophosphatase
MTLQGKSPEPSHRSLLDACVSAARAAGLVIAGSAGSLSSLTWEEKTESDFVSDVDRAAEREIATFLRSHFPAATLVGEELSPGDSLGADLAFIVDPLDGTTNFLHGYPEYSVSVAAASSGKLLAGAVLNVPSGELFTATAGGGSFRNGERISVSSIEDPGRALIGTGFPFKRHDLLERYLPQFDRVMRGTAGIRRAGSAAIDLANLACGRFDGFWELDLAPWDIAAGMLIVREAGGCVTDLAGKEAGINFGGFVAGNPAIHQWLLGAIQNSAR